MRAADRLSRHAPAAAATCCAVAAIAMAGCGSRPAADLPSAAAPDRSPPLRTTPEGSVAPLEPEVALHAARPARSAFVQRDRALRVLLDPRRRRLMLMRDDGITSSHIRDEIPVGVGPTQLACSPLGPCFVTDTTGDALLVVRVAPDGRWLRLTRRVYLAGAPYAIALDSERRRLWVTLTARNELVELPANGRPHILRRHPTVRQPDGVDAQRNSGDVFVTGLRPPRLQRLTRPATPDRP